MERWYSVDYESLMHEYVCLFEIILTKNDGVNSASVLLEDDVEILDMNNGRRSLVVNKVRINGIELDLDIEISGSADDIWIYINNSSWQFNWNGDYVGGNNKRSLSEFMLNKLEHVS